jgi:hypothetical protein
MARWPVFAIAVLLLLGSATALAGDATTTFQRGHAALVEGRYSDAIAELERLSDLGQRDANASFDRGLAYLGRAESGHPRDGDLGQAAAAFREARVLGDTSEETERALEQVRDAISRQRATRGLDPVVVRPAIDRALLLLVPESLWAIVAAIASLALAVGLWLRGSDKTSPRALTGQVASYSGGILLVGSVLVSFFAARLRTSEREAVVIATEAPILDASGTRRKSRALDVAASAIPEGASVFVTEQQGRLAQVHWGSTQAWVEIGRLRLISQNLEL